jgi:hypothetical protein
MARSLCVVLGRCIALHDDARLLLSPSTARVRARRREYCTTDAGPFTATKAVASLYFLGQRVDVDACLPSIRDASLTAHRKEGNGTERSYGCSVRCYGYIGRFAKPYLKSSIP